MWRSRDSESGHAIVQPANVDLRQIRRISLSTHSELWAASLATVSHSVGMLWKGNFQTCMVASCSALKSSCTQ